MLGAVITGSSETTLYVAAVYFGAVSISKMRYAIHAGIIADVIGFVASLAVCSLILR
jgi:spore maturation protein B